VSKSNKKRQLKKRKHTSAARTPLNNASSTVPPTDVDSVSVETQISASHVQPGHTTAATLAPYDESLLDVCRSRWQCADWQGLAIIETVRLAHHPQRDKIALLIAAAHWQLGNTQEAQRFTQAALDAGASKRPVAQLLISGVHQCLANSRKMLGDEQGAFAHCLEAVNTGGVPGDGELLANVRMQRMQTNKMKG